MTDGRRYFVHWMARLRLGTLRILREEIDGVREKRMSP